MALKRKTRSTAAQRALVKARVKSTAKSHVRALLKRHNPTGRKCRACGRVLMSSKVSYCTVNCAVSYYVKREAKRT